MKNFLFIIFVLFLIPSIQGSEAGQVLTELSDNVPAILISYSDTAEKIVFDGKWTERSEWKQSSWDIVKYQGSDAVHLRSSHQGEFIYILLDVVGDQTLNHISDKALVCIDGKNDKTIIANDNDFCFQTSLGSKQGFILQGGSPLVQKGNFEKIHEQYGFVGIGETSDQNDKYSAIPHASYEFKIPMELFGRSDVYGFYFYVYDSNTSTYFTWPSDLIPTKPFDIPSPSKWGHLVSPDKSIPEFEIPLLILIPAIFLAIYLTKFKPIK